MAAILFRVAVLSVGLGLVQISIVDGIARDALFAWPLVMLLGLVMVVVGAAGVIGPLLVTGRENGGRNDA